MRTSAATAAIRKRLIQSSRSFRDQPDLLTLRDATLHPFRTTSNKKPFRKLDWTVGAKEAWAVLGPEANLLVECAMMGRCRAEPKGALSWPFLQAREVDMSKAIQRVRFSVTRAGQDSGFVDWTARWGGIRDEDKLTLLQHLSCTAQEATIESIESIAEQLDIGHLLSMPLIALSNGQTRRARIAKALLATPEILILEEPFSTLTTVVWLRPMHPDKRATAGLDVSSRDMISRLLGRLHASGQPRMVLTLRQQDEMPDYITHILDIGPDRIPAFSGPRLEWSPKPIEGKSATATSSDVKRASKVIVRVDGASVTGLRPILINVDWTIREGDRWWLRGPNGSGKSTLLGLITGQHPQSYSSPISILGRPRSSYATSQLHKLVGLVSPELSSAFPRRVAGPGALSAKEAIATGFEGVFCYFRTSSEQNEVVDQFLSDFDYPEVLDEATLRTPFAMLPTSLQSLILFLRAFVARPALVILDEAFSGMDAECLKRCHRFLEEKLPAEQALIVVSHYEEEIPRTVTKILNIDGGKVVEAID